MCHVCDPPLWASLTKIKFLRQKKKKKKRNTFLEQTGEVILEDNDKLLFTVGTTICTNLSLSHAEYDTET